MENKKQIFIVIILLSSATFAMEFSPCNMGNAEEFGYLAHLGGFMQYKDS